jgi:hypothetical protein
MDFKRHLPALQSANTNIEVYQNSPRNGSLKAI